MVKPTLGDTLSAVTHPYVAARLRWRPGRRRATLFFCVVGARPTRMEHEAPAARPILLVEDEADDVEFVRRALGSAHIVNPLVIRAREYEAREYLTGAAGESQLPAVILVDVYLRGSRSGLEFLDWVRSQPEPVRGLPVMILTVSTDHTHQARASKLGAALFLFKPITADVLVEGLQRLGLVVTRSGSGSSERAMIEAGP